MLGRVKIHLWVAAGSIMEEAQITVSEIIFISLCYKAWRITKWGSLRPNKVYITIRVFILEQMHD